VPLDSRTLGGLQVDSSLVTLGPLLGRCAGSRQLAVQLSGTSRGTKTTSATEFLPAPAGVDQPFRSLVDIRVRQGSGSLLVALAQVGGSVGSVEASFGRGRRLLERPNGAVVVFSQRVPGRGDGGEVGVRFEAHGATGAVLEVASLPGPGTAAVAPTHCGP
jgi:hypothetical protein